MRKLRVCLVLLAASCLVVAGGTVPVTYKAPTDMAVRPKPPVPHMGPAGSIINDPTYGSRILRVTDGNSEAGYPNGSFLTPAAGWLHNWNADSTMFWVHAPAGIIPYKFDSATMTATALPYLAITGPFSYRKPNILYGNKDLKILEYDFNTGKYTEVFDAARAVPGAPGGSYTPSVSDDDSKLAMAFGGIQETYQYIAVLDRNTGKYSVLDTKNSRIDGRAANITMGCGIHSVYMDRTGRYMIIGKGQGNTGKSQWLVWDVQGGKVAEILANWSGHDASGFGVRVNESGFFGGTPSFYEEVEYAVRSLDLSQIDSPKYLIAPENLATPHVSGFSGHISWNNAQPGTMVPVLGSHYRNGLNKGSQPWRAWDDEIIAVATDGSGKVWRFAHHRSLYDGSNFWDSPRGNVSQDGRFYLFTSNWERTLGKTHKGATRQDVFLVELTAAETVNAQVPVQAQAPVQAQPQAPATPAPAQAPAPARAPARVLSANLLTDPGFEAGAQGWYDALHQPGVAITAGQRRSGNVSMKIDGITGRHSIYQIVRVYSGVLYGFSGWALGAGAGTGMQVEWLDAARRQIGQIPVGNLYGAKGWTFLQTAVVAPVGAAWARVRAFSMSGSGATYFDDLAMRAVLK